MPTPAPIAYGPALLVRGTDSCSSGSQSVSSPDPAGVTHVEVELICTMHFNDPRVSGTKTGLSYLEAWDPGAFVQWSTTRRIDGQEGDWLGGFTGVYTIRTGDMITAWYEGIGPNAGLSFFHFIAAPPGTVTGYRTVGLIFPGPPPPDQSTPAELPSSPVAPPFLEPSGTPMPSPRTWGPVTLVQGTEVCSGLDATSLPTPDASGQVMAQDVSRLCAAEFNDARVSGSKVLGLNYTGWGTGPETGASVQWGPARIENAAGTWEGSFSGAYTAETGDMASAWFEGTGAYSGFSLFEWIAAPPGTLTTGYPVVGFIFPGSPPPH